MYVCIYTYLYIYIERERDVYMYIYIYRLHARCHIVWSRTDGVDTNGAPAKVMNLDRSGEKIRPGTLGR